MRTSNPKPKACDSVAVASRLSTGNMVCAESTEEKPASMSASIGVRMPPGWSGKASRRPSWNMTVNVLAPRLNTGGALRGTRS
jgi:hypothetical protein